MARFKPAESRPAEEWQSARGAIRPVERAVAEETPVGIAYDGRPQVVLMATPADIEDLAAGFTVSEGIAPAAGIAEIRVTESDEGVSVDVRLVEDAARDRRRWRRRSMEGRSSCGLCGVERLKAAVRPLARIDDGFVISRSAISAALAALGGEQALGALTRATHAAAVADRAGRLLVVREDVGRHNALDKAVGAALRAGLPLSESFLLVTSRCSYEMVEKAAFAGAPVIVAISAPTALAIRKAEEAEMTLVALARGDGHAVFTRPDRIADPVAVPA